MNASSQSRRGFTLLEVMVATSIMVIIVLAVVQIAADTFKGYDRAVADLSTQSEARGVLDALENDLQTAVLRPDGNCWMEIILPGTSVAPVKAPGAIGNIQGVDQPILMFFATPPDRPRWNPSASTPRQSLKGDICSVCYRLGQRSPFDMPGEPIQQVYGVYRTIVDPEGTFSEALPIILKSPPASEPAPGVAGAPTPWDYWSGPARWISNYSASDTSGAKQQKVLINANVTASPPCWTLDDQNFIGSNIVAMNLTLWCSSSLPSTATLPAMKDPVARMPQSLRPVIPVSADTFKYGSTVYGGYSGAFKSNTSLGPTSAAPLRYAPPSAATIPAFMPSAAQVHPYDYFGSRLRVFADRMYPDALMTAPVGVVTAAPLPYLPYSLRAMEVSLTVLTPDGAKELRALQQLGGSATLTNSTDFKRIVNNYGRNYTRYIRLLANGG
jgi:prepilin-type N-terminal cleavage/methylation domain-containing protein